MANHIKNILYFNKKQYPNIFEELLDSNGNFDFNKIISMPDSLRLVAGSLEGIAIQYALMKNEESKDKDLKILENTRTDFYGNYLRKYCAEKKDKEYLEEQNKKFKESLLKNDSPFDDYSETYEKYNIKDLNDLGKLYLKNLKDYGFINWYDWCIENWGTKWNAYEQQHFSIRYDNVIIFETAWSYPKPIIEKLAKKYDFNFKYADEDIGNNCGKIAFADGEAIVFDIKDTYGFAKRVWKYSE